MSQVAGARDPLDIRIQTVLYLRKTRPVYLDAAEALIIVAKTPGITGSFLSIVLLNRVGKEHGLNTRRRERIEHHDAKTQR